MKKPFTAWTKENKQSFELLRKKIADRYGIDKIYPASARYFSSYTIMVALVSCLQVFVVIYGSQFFDISFLTVSTGWFILLPIMQYLFQIVTEVYGWEYGRQLVLCNFICNGLSTFLYFAFSFVTYSAKYAHASPIDEQLVVFYGMMSHRLTNSIVMWVGMFISDYVTCLLMSWSKFQMGNRLMMLRILVLHFVSEMLLQLLGVCSDLYKGVPLYESLNAIINSIFSRTIMMLVLLPIATWVIHFLQNKVEKVVVCDVKRDLSPFKFKVTQFYSFYIPSDEVNNKKSVNKMFDTRDMKEMLALYEQEFGEKYQQ